MSYHVDEPRLAGISQICEVVHATACYGFRLHASRRFGAEQRGHIMREEMSVAYYIVLNNEEPDFDTFVNGKSLARAVEQIDVICGKLGIRNFDDFLTMSADDIADMLGEDIELPEGEGEKWFTADEGIAFFASLVDHIRANPADVKNPEGVLDDLAEYNEVLQKAKGIGAKWHLNLDI